ncbi:hypothetical protein ARMSODRAFT_967834 [Armillaria solidipes]|uniref:Uncharacterized protein n=1 Tax=Armillaria solidipes TaxID=1076256 RepID=A0A2H3ANI2_9AGAR|nr:hypothetical protein ARMSODRAFT_967834 [Armillaria solidipes]
MEGTDTAVVITHTRTRMLEEGCLARHHPLLYPDHTHLNQGAPRARRHCPHILSIRSSPTYYRGDGIPSLVSLGRCRRLSSRNFLFFSYPYFLLRGWSPPQWFAFSFTTHWLPLIPGHVRFQHCPFILRQSRVATPSSKETLGVCTTSSQ